MEAGVDHIQFGDKKRNISNKVTPSEAGELLYSVNVMEEGSS